MTRETYDLFGIFEAECEDFVLRIVANFIRKIKENSDTKVIIFLAKLVTPATYFPLNCGTPFS
jgi:hypothetical protein